MTTIYRVRSTDAIHYSDPLHVGRFYSGAQRVHRKTTNCRQDLILYLAGIHAAAVKTGQPLGFCRIPMRLTSLREWVYDYRPAFDYFFQVVEQGYNLANGQNEISIVIPKKLPHDIVRHKLEYVPPPRPASGVESTVFIHQHRADAIRKKLTDTGRLDLHAPVNWLLQHNEVRMIFAPSGRLQLRDTSVWPISAVETWPAWLREDLFGEGIDIESAYTQFIVTHLRDAYADRPQMVNVMFPDLIRSLEDKKKWRQEICEGVLGLEPTEQNIGIVKKICMSLANGSRISPGIMLSGFSVTKDIIIQKTEDVTPSNLIKIGERLSNISKQYSHARKLVCCHEMGVSPSRANQKLVFASYFQWERTARYKIWEAVGRHGVMVHDGIDGIPPEYLRDIPGLVKSLNIRLT